MSQSILNEYDTIYEEYNDIYDNCKGKLDKAEKIKRHRVIEVEKNMLENNRTEMNTTERQILMGYVWAFIATMINMGTFYNNILGSENIVLPLCVIILIFLLFVLVYLIKIDKNAKTRDDEYNQIRKICLTQKVLEDLLLEENQFSL